MVQWVRIVSPMSDQEYRFRSAVGSLLLFSPLILLAFGALLSTPEWRSFERPINYIAALYYYTVYIPINWFGYVWTYLRNSSITPYENLNLVLSIVGTSIYGLILFLMYTFAAKGLSNFFNVSKKGAFKIFLIPAFLALIWLTASYVLSWLFA